MRNKLQDIYQYNVEEYNNMLVCIEDRRKEFI